MARKHYNEYYETIADLVETCTTTWERNSRPGARSSRNPGDKDFYGPDSFLDCVGYITRGWGAGAQTMLAGVEALEQGNEIAVAEHDVAGHYPDPALVAAGDPMNMVREGDELGSETVIKLGFNTCASWRVTAEQKTNFGIGFLTCIRALTMQGYSLEISAFDKCAVGSWGDLTIRTLVKPAGEIMDMDLLAFVLAHPGFLRRFMFAVREQDPKYSKICDRNYGSPASVRAEDLPGENIYILPGLSSPMRELNSPKTALLYLITLTNRVIGRELLSFDVLGA
tara:strand:+ start:329 stop:1174 length:846 start_codon:yes stop_codon:yes gene_type:complete